MPRIPKISPATNEPTPAYYTHIASSSFVDSAGRVLILRGVNLSGSDKAPVNRPSQQLEGFWETGENGGESFVGRPLDLDDPNGSADQHLARLRGWGFNVIRYVVTWEALEHEGPKKYDYEFMDYTVRVLRKIKEYGFKVYMDPHQDVWSRYSGGSGAPYWTLIACGLNPRNFSAGLSSVIHSEWPLPNMPAPETVPAMIWSTNYTRLVSQTVWTLFFAGRQFAPKAMIDGINIQDWLQSHFVDAFGLLADRIRDAGDLLDECIIGWDSINEPGEGFLGLENLNEIPKHQALKKGPTPTPIQGLRLGMGIPQTVENWTFGGLGPSKDGSVTIDPAGRRIWSDPSTEVNGVNQRWGWKRDARWELGVCIWALHGVWDPESGQALIPDYFAYTREDDGLDSERPPGARISFVQDYWRPHWRKYSARIVKSHPEAIHFIQPPVFVQPPPLEEDDLKGRGAYSAHYYDGLTLMSRHWNWFNADALGILRGRYSTVLQAVKIGEAAIRRSLREQLGILKADAHDILGRAYPTLIGEIGTPMDMDGRRAYGWTDDGKHKGDYSSQLKALDASLNAADGVNGLNYTMWTYCPDSTHAWGDGWNMEDLSIWSADDLRSSPRKRTRSYETGTVSSNARLLHNHSRATSHSSGADGEERIPKSTLATGPSPTFYGNQSMDSIGSAITVSNDYQLRSRNAMTGDCAKGSPLKDAVAVTVQPAASTSSPHISFDLPYVPPSNPLSFLTDGARAVGAFARPYPRATIGMPKTIDFILAKADFKFVVTVSPTDAPSKNLGISDEEGSLVPTEIFLPIVHFASDLYAKEFDKADGGHCPIGGTRRRSEGSDDQDGTSASLLSTDAEESKRRRSDTLVSEATQRTFDMSSSLTLTRTFPTNPLKAKHLPSSHYSTNIPPEAYAITVEVSHGTWSLDSQAQTLKWWYPVPETGEGDVEYSIRVRRQGGAIKKIADGTSTKPAGQLRSEMAEPDDWCCGTCTIM